MDSVIIDLLEGMLNGGPEPHAFDEFRLHAAQTRHKLRVIEDLPPSAARSENVWCSQLIEGERAWTLLKDIAASLGQAGRLPVSYREWAFAVAMRLNALPLTPRVRDRLILQLIEASRGFPNDLDLPGEDELRMDETTGTRLAFDEFLDLFLHVYAENDRDILTESVEDLVTRLSLPGASLLD